MGLSIASFFSFIGCFSFSFHPFGLYTVNLIIGPGEEDQVVPRIGQVKQSLYPLGLRHPWTSTFSLRPPDETPVLVHGGIMDGYETGSMTNPVPLACYAGHAHIISRLQHEHEMKNTLPLNISSLRKKRGGTNNSAQPVKHADSVGRGDFCRATDTTITEKRRKQKWKDEKRRGGGAIYRIIQ